MSTVVLGLLPANEEFEALDHGAFMRHYEACCEGQIRPQEVVRRWGPDVLQIMEAQYAVQLQETAMANELYGEPLQAEELRAGAGIVPLPTSDDPGVAAASGVLGEPHGVGASTGMSTSGIPEGLSVTVDHQRAYVDHKHQQDMESKGQY